MTVMLRDYFEAFALYGRPLGRFEKGTKWAHFSGRQASTPPPWKGPSDADLAAYYRKPAEEIPPP